MFLGNAWYVACKPDEIGEKLLARTICNEKLVFYRQADGRPAAVEDFCPHRGAALSKGQVCEGKLVCGYHGLVMGCDGKTVSMPGQRVQGFPKIRSFPVAQKYGFIWVWPGDPALADVSKIHHLEWAESPDWAVRFNDEAKRLILAGVYSSTLLRWLNDTSQDEKATFEFLDARIENVMQFEKLKARLKPLSEGVQTAVGVAARFRYGPD